MRATIFAVALALVLLLAGCGGDAPDPDTDAGGSSASQDAGSAASTSEETPAPGLSTVTIDAAGGRVAVQVEVADNLRERARGLMYRTALAEDRGMLFVYPEESELSFYMRNTLIPLSVAFIDSKGRIVDIQDMKPLDDDLPHYVSAKPAKYGLEVNKGFFDERGVEVGDRADLPD